jgi:predicted enzyme related to lactoylglutathione lyase
MRQICVENNIPIQEAKTTPFGGRRFFIRDPFGNRMELVQLK